MAAKSCPEVPLQDFARIQLMFLPNALSNGKLFTDYCFPPDKSSLTYVYSGDDRYDRMVFKRPKDISKSAVFAGVGGVHSAPYPWKQWTKSGWFEAAISVVSVNFKQMDKLIPGYRNFDQSLQTDYIGCFCFKLWRFGDWITVVVDDHLPTLNNRLLYCQAHGDPSEFWGPLLEKAYAKCKKTYEANECGRTLDALTDLTGGICEFFTPDINPPENFFHILYKSCVNRSQLVCWRNEKLLTPAGFLDGAKPNEAENERSANRYLHIVTATTKFPLSDGRMIEMVRLLSPNKQEPLWRGKFSDKDEVSRATINKDFCTKYKPFENKEYNEYWMTLEDFRCNFGGLIICSSDSPYTTEGLNIARVYRRQSEEETKSNQKPLFPNKEQRRSSDVKRPSRQSVPEFYFQRNSHPSLQPVRRRRRNIHSKNRQLSGENSGAKDVHTEPGIMVRENYRTVKVDNTMNSDRGKRVYKLRQSSSDSSKSEPSECMYGNRDSPVSCLKRFHINVDKPESDKGHNLDHVSSKRKPIPREQDIVSIKRTSDIDTNGTTKYDPLEHKHDLIFSECRSGSIASNCSVLSECTSTFSASDITLNMPATCSRENSFARPVSAPIPRNASSGSLPNLTVNNFVAMSSDNFRSHGSWRLVVEYKGSWERSSSSISSLSLKHHSRNPRILLSIIHADAVNEIVASGYHGKSHVIISLLQDYRHGAPTANSLLVPIGFSIYKTKNPSKDEKRPLSRLPQLGETESTKDVREITSRFDLHPGNYFIVPYCLSESHSGQFMIRAVAEKDPVAGKTGCVLS